VEKSNVKETKSYPASPGFRSMVKNCTKFPVPNNAPAV